MRVGFDRFVLDLDSGRLLREGSEVTLAPRAVLMLCYLARHPGRLIQKDELLEQVWDVNTLSDGVLSNTVAKLRKALGQGARDRSPIETVYGRGYRLNTPVEELGASQSRASVAAMPVPGDEPDEETFVARRHTLELIEKALAHGAAARGQLILIVGEPGIGKTRTARELSRRARARGMHVWSGSAYEGGGAPPYWPWVEILRDAHAQLGAERFGALVPSDAWAIGKLVPELSLTGAPPADADGQALRFRLFDEIARLLMAASGERPVLVWIDDLHWADSGSVELLLHATRALRGERVVLAATLREHDPEAPADSMDSMRRLGRLGTPLSLSGLSLDETHALAAALTGDRELPRALSQALHDRTDGNPLFVQQLLHLLDQDGKPRDAASIETLPLPSGVRVVIQRRIEGMPAETRRLLAAAAVLGQEVDLAPLSKLTGLADDAILTTIEPAVAADIAEHHPTVPHRLRFTQPVLRESLYLDLPLQERGQLHARAARVLDEIQVDSDARHLGEVARHYLLAVPSELDRSVEACRRAADAAREASGFEAAAQFLARAADKLAREGGKPEIRAELLVTLGVDLFCVGQLKRCWRRLHEAAEVAIQIGNGALLAEAAFRLADCIELGEGDEAFVLSTIDKATELLGDDGQDRLRVSLLAHRAELGFDLSTPQRLALLERADAIAQQREAPEALLEIAHARAVMRDPTRLDDNRAAADAMLLLMDRHPRVSAGMRNPVLRRFGVHVTQYLCALTSCDLVKADAALSLCEVTATRSRVAALLLIVEMMRAGRALGDGRCDDLEQQLNRIVGESDEGGEGSLAIAWQYYFGALIEGREQLELLANIEPPDPFARRELSTRYLVASVIVMARLRARTGHEGDARRLLSGLKPAQLSRMPVHHGDLGLLCSLADTYEALGDTDAAGPLYAQLTPYADLNAVNPTFDYGGSVAHSLGVLASMSGDLEGARKHFEHALEVNSALGMPLRVRQTEARLAALD